jgi:preprotein translocase subunit SecG
MTTALLIIQSILAVIITVAILLQAQGTGLGSTWAGGGETYHTKRGVEKVIFYLTCVSVAIFTIVSILVITL